MNDYERQWMTYEQLTIKLPAKYCPFNLFMICSHISFDSILKKNKNDYTVQGYKMFFQSGCS